MICLESTSSLCENTNTVLIYSSYFNHFVLKIRVLSIWNWIALSLHWYFGEKSGRDAWRAVRQGAFWTPNSPILSLYLYQKMA